MSKPRLAIGEVYLAGCSEAPDRYYTFEICGELWIDGRRIAIAVSHPPRKGITPTAVLFDTDGRGEVFGCEYWTQYRSKARPRYQQTAQ